MYIHTCIYIYIYVVCVCVFNTGDFGGSVLEFTCHECWSKRHYNYAIFRLLVFIYKAVHSNAIKYLHYVVCPYTPA